MDLQVLLYGIFLSYETRNVHDVFNESKTIAFVIYNVRTSITFALLSSCHAR